MRKISFSFLSVQEVKIFNALVTCLYFLNLAAIGKFYYISVFGEYVKSFLDDTLGTYIRC